jgi:uncharacterized membrane protein
MNNEPKVNVFYEKSYMDDCGKNIPDLFSKNNFDKLAVKSYWGNSIDAFTSYNCLYMITAISGEFRIVIANKINDEYKFTQYFISGMDGKTIKIPKNTLIGINNLMNNTGALIVASVGEDYTTESIDRDIFDWYDKR